MYSSSTSVSALHKQVAVDYRERSTMASQGSPPGSTFAPDLMMQRGIIEQHLLDKKLVEGDFWYIVVVEWLEQLKKYLGIASARKMYCPRSPPGPILTKKELGYTAVDVVHADAWRYLHQWYGLAESHRPQKMAVYNYNNTPGIEHNLNSFKVMICNSPPEEFHICRFSKMEKIGHIEWKTRELYRIPRSQTTRLWGKSDTDTEWKPLFSRDKTIGKVLGVDSDFTRPNITMEICDVSQTWNNCPAEVENLQEEPTGPLYDHDIFEDVTTAWEVDIHEQIESIGKHFLGKLHANFGCFVHRAKGHMDEKENCLRERERDIIDRENFVDVRLRKLDEKEGQLNGELRALESRSREIERIYEIKETTLVKNVTEREGDVTQQIQILAKEREIFAAEKNIFDQEVKRASEINTMLEGKIKLDIGGMQFTTSLMTLHKDPNSMLAAMFSGRHQLKAEPDGSYFIDRDGVHFRYILNYLRDGGIKEGTLPHSETFWRELQSEAEYYQITGLVQYLDSLICPRQPSEQPSESSEPPPNTIV